MAAWMQVLTNAIGMVFPAVHLFLRLLAGLVSLRRRFCLNKRPFSFYLATSVCSRCPAQAADHSAVAQRQQGMEVKCSFAPHVAIYHREFFFGYLLLRKKMVWS